MINVNAIVIFIDIDVILIKSKCASFDYTQLYANSVLTSNQHATAIIPVYSFEKL